MRKPWLTKPVKPPSAVGLKFPSPEKALIGELFHFLLSDVERIAPSRVFAMQNKKSIPTQGGRRDRQQGIWRRMFMNMFEYKNDKDPPSETSVSIAAENLIQQAEFLKDC